MQRLPILDLSRLTETQNRIPKKVAFVPLLQLHALDIPFILDLLSTIMPYQLMITFFPVLFWQHGLSILCLND